MEEEYVEEDREEEEDYTFTHSSQHFPPDSACHTLTRSCGQYGF